MERNYVLMRRCLAEYISFLYLELHVSVWLPFSCPIWRCQMQSQSSLSGNHDLYIPLSDAFLFENHGYGIDSLRPCGMDGAERAMLVIWLLDTYKSYGL